MMLKTDSEKVALNVVDENHQLGKERVTGPRIIKGREHSILLERLTLHDSWPGHSLFSKLMVFVNDG